METLKHIENAVLDDGSMVRGHLYHTLKGDLTGGTAGHLIQNFGTAKRYSLGARLVTGDGRVFRYAKAGATLNTDLGCKSYNQQHIGITYVAVATVVGALTVVLDVQGTDGDGGDGKIAADELVGGYIVIFPHSENSINRMIVGNTATTGAGEMTITLDDPLPVALVADSAHGECMASPYLDVRSTGETTSSIVGVPCVPATAGNYLWIQTWGPVWIAPQGEVSVGTNNRQVVFRHDGSIDEYDATDANTIKAQHAGFVLQNARGGGQGAAFIMLQISI